LLARLGLSFEVQPADVDEAAAMAAGGEPAGVAVALARAKAQAVAEQRPEALVVGADTIVVLGGSLLGKPADAAEARRMLALLRERTHLVVTGVALVGPGGVWEGSGSTRVWTRAYREREVEASISRGDPFDKAGAYAIQDPILRPVRRIEGCRCNVIGLPLAMVAVGMSAFRVWPSDEALAALPEECRACFAEVGLA